MILPDKRKSGGVFRVLVLLYGYLYILL